MKENPEITIGVEVHIEKKWILPRKEWIDKSVPIVEFKDIVEAFIEPDGNHNAVKINLGPLSVTLIREDLKLLINRWLDHKCDICDSPIDKVEYLKNEQGLCNKCRRKYSNGKKN